MKNALEQQAFGTQNGYDKPTIIQGTYIDKTDAATICIQGNCIDRADTAGCNGKGWTEDVSYTLNTIDRPAVVQSVPLLDDQGGGVMKGNDFAKVAPTLRTQTHGHLPIVAVKKRGDE